MRGYIGIDPGVNKKSPGCAAILIDGGSFQLSDWRDEKRAFRALDGWRSAFEVKAAIERIPVAVRPGLFPSMKLGVNYGFWIGLLTALNIKFEIVAANTWQARLLLKGAGADTKERSIFTASKMINGAADALKSKYKHSGRADALLIALYLKHKCELKLKS